MEQNFTEIVHPFLRVVDASPVESFWPIVNLGPKALVSIYLFPNTVPEAAMHHMNIVTFLFYFYCTQHLQQCVWSFICMSLSLFLMYREPSCSYRSIDASSWYMMVAITASHPGCEFSLDVFLMVGLSFWLVQKFEQKNAVKFFFVLWLSFVAFFLPTIRFIIAERNRYVDNSITESVENIVNANNSITENILNANNSITENILKANDSIRENILKANDSIKENILKANDSIKDNILNTNDSIKDNILKANVSIKDNILNTNDSIKENILNANDSIKENIPSVNDTGASTTGHVLVDEL